MPPNNMRQENMHQEGLEPSTDRLEGGCSIQLSYWCKKNVFCVLHSFIRSMCCA